MFVCLFIFREGEGKERETERNINVCVPLTCPLLAHNPGLLCSDWKLNWRPFGWQASIQTTEPQQPGKLFINFLTIFCIFLVSDVISLLSLLILFIWVLSLFFLMSLVNGFFFIFSKNKLLDPLIFCIIFSESISSISTLNFIISFCLLVVLFQVPLSVKLNCLFELFIFFFNLM